MNHQIIRASVIHQVEILPDLALYLNQGEDTLFREDIKVTMAESYLYDFLLKVATVSGVLKSEEGSGEETKEKEEKKPTICLDFAIHLQTLF